MSILVDNKTRVICQGLTGKEATFHSELNIAYGTYIVAGVTPGKGGQKHLGLPIFNTVKEACAATSANTTIIYVPEDFCKDAILEALDAGIKLIISVTENVPMHDMLEIKMYLKKYPQARLIGPQSPGIITPGECNIGTIPGEIFMHGKVGIISRSATLLYEAAQQLTQMGIGQSTCVGMGNDILRGTNYIDFLSLFEKDLQTDIILLLGESSGMSENQAAAYIQQYIKKPVIAHLAGITAYRGKRMGHAGAIITEGKETIAIKYAMLRAAHVHVVYSMMEIGKKIVELHHKE
jgi:succinyl-CoA synthetase alpha subunit